MAEPVRTAAHEQFCTHAANVTGSVTQFLTINGEAGWPSVEAWFQSLPPLEQQNLVIYLIAAVHAWDSGVPPSAVAQAAFQYCMENEGA